MKSEDATVLSILAIFLIGMGFVNWRIPIITIGALAVYMVLYCLIKLFYMNMGLE